MTRTQTQSSSTTRISKKASKSQETSALLVRVERLKKKASALQEEMEFYYGNVTELLALSQDMMEALQLLEKAAPQLEPVVTAYTSRQHHLIKQLLGFWPRSIPSQRRISDLLDADGLEKLLDVTADGYVSLSSDRILENVERIIGHTREQNPSP